METYKTDIRIIAGNLKGRKIVCQVHEKLRPTPQRVREALFSILGNAVPDRTFIDIFAGTGVNGLEAISRKAKDAIFLERDSRLATEIEKYLRQFGVADKGSVLRSDVYRWVERWIPPKNPVNCFLSPPFPDLTDRLDDFLEVITTLMDKLPDESCLILQVEDGFQLDRLPDLVKWDCRKYGRNILCIWVKGEFPEPGDLPVESESEDDDSP